MTKTSGLVLLDRHETQRRTALSKSTMHDLMRRGLFPRPVVVGARKVAWAESEVDEWIRARLAERDGTDHRQPAA